MLAQLERPVCEMTDHERIAAITKAIKTADKDMRRRFPILRFQSAIGLGSFLLVGGVSIISAWLYLDGVFPGWLTLVINAICFSIVREIEHDLIHNLYFPRHPWVQNLLMLAVWPFLGNLPHPWYRRRMHLLHHRTSGHDEDFEEQLIGNGLPFGPLKLLAMFEPGLASLFRQKEFARIPFYKSREFFQALIPVAVFYLAAAYGLLVLHVGAWIMSGLDRAVPSAWSQTMHVLDLIAVVWMLPNMLRQVCLQIISGNMHYFGNVENRLQETQVFNGWWALPFNLFTFNFGRTHSIHHFVVNQPYYLRQMVAGTAHAAFQKYGVRYNDLGTIVRGNRY